VSPGLVRTIADTIRGLDDAALCRAVRALSDERLVGLALPHLVAGSGGADSTPQGVERERSPGARTPAAHAPAPRLVATDDGDEAPPRERRRPVRRARAERPAPAPPPSGVRHLPTMLVGPGPRHDCEHEAECLGRVSRRSPNARAVHCPPACAHLAPPSLEWRFDNACAGHAQGNG